MTASVLDNRYHYLDGVRAFALILGIVFHASMSFFPVYIGWAVMDISTSSLIGQFILVSHSFRMELFFLIAGFFTRMLLNRKGAIELFKSRLIRIFVPFIVGWFLFKPLIISGWVMGAESLRGEVNILGGLGAGFMSLKELPAGILTGTHLWFLYYLLIITSLVFILRWSMLPFSILNEKIDKGLNMVLPYVVKSPFMSVLFAIPTGICLWFMNYWGMDTPEKSLLPHIPVLLVYLGFFGSGWLLQRTKESVTVFSKISITRVVICLFSVAGAIYFSRFQQDPVHQYISLMRVASIFNYAVMMWSLVALSIGLFRILFNKPNAIVRYISDSSYWLYLIHLPIVVWLQIAFAEMELHWSIKLCAVSLLTIMISIVSYDLFVRSTPLGQLLNGRKKQRVLLRQILLKPLDPKPALVEQKSRSNGFLG